MGIKGSTMRLSCYCRKVLRHVVTSSEAPIQALSSSWKTSKHFLYSGQATATTTTSGQHSKRTRTTYLLRPLSCEEWRRDLKSVSQRHYLLEIISETLPRITYLDKTFKKSE